MDWAYSVNGKNTLYCGSGFLEFHYNENHHPAHTAHKSSVVQLLIYSRAARQYISQRNALSLNRKNKFDPQRIVCSQLSFYFSNALVSGLEMGDDYF